MARVAGVGPTKGPGAHAVGGEVLAVRGADHAERAWRCWKSAEDCASAKFSEPCRLPKSFRIASFAYPRDTDASEAGNSKQKESCTLVLLV